MNNRKEMEYNELKVSSKSNPNSIAGMIAALIKEGETYITLQGIGAGAVNQAVKAIATARGFVAPQGINLTCIPAFQQVNIDGDSRTAIKFILEVR